jgi:hypothetical protein
MLPSPEAGLGGFDRQSRVFREGAVDLLVPPFLGGALLRVEGSARAEVLQIAEDLARHPLTAPAQVLLEVADIHVDVEPPQPVREVGQDRGRDLEESLLLARA